MKFIEEMFLMALDLELSPKAHSNRKFTFKIKKRCSMCEGSEHHAYKCPSIKCFKCGEFGHYDYQCPQKSQHSHIVRTDDINNSRIVDDIYISPKVTTDVDE